NEPSVLAKRSATPARSLSARGGDPGTSDMTATLACYWNAIVRGTAVTRSLPARHRDRSRCPAASHASFVAPSAGTCAFALGEHAGEVALIAESAGGGDVGECHVGRCEKAHGPFQAAHDEPSMRRHAGRRFERAGEIRGGETAFGGDLHHGRV